MQPWEREKPRYKKPQMRLRDLIAMKANQLALGLVIAGVIYVQMIYSNYNRPNTKTRK